MKIRTQPDVIELNGSDVFAILQDTAMRLYGRQIDQITWVNVVEHREVGKVDASQDININATLKPKDE